MTPLASLVIGFLCAAALGCQGVSDKPAQSEAPSRTVYPNQVRPCLEAMNALPVDFGGHLRGVTEKDDGCAISIWFDSEDEIRSFREERRNSGYPPNSVEHRLSDGSVVRIDLSLQVGERTVPH